MLTALAVAAIPTVAGWLARVPQPPMAVASVVKPLPLATVVQTRFVDLSPLNEATLEIVEGDAPIHVAGDHLQRSSVVHRQTADAAARHIGPLEKVLSIMDPLSV